MTSLARAASGDKAAGSKTMLGGQYGAETALGDRYICH